MKTAEEWAEIRSKMELEISWQDEPQVQLQEFAAWLKQVQLDAMKEGARRAHKIQQETPPSEHCECGKAILTTADQWTEKDL